MSIKTVDVTSKPLVQIRPARVVKLYMSLLSVLFSSRVRAEILGLLFNEPTAELNVREIVRRSGLTLGTAQQGSRSSRPSIM